MRGRTQLWWCGDSGALDIQRVPGGHLTMLTEPAVAGTAEAVRAAIDRHVISRRPTSRPYGRGSRMTSLEAADQQR